VNSSSTTNNTKTAIVTSRPDITRIYVLLVAVPMRHLSTGGEVAADEDHRQNKREYHRRQSSVAVGVALTALGDSHSRALLGIVTSAHSPLPFSMMIGDIPLNKTKGDQLCCKF
jgi:hypothetical protein